MTSDGLENLKKVMRKAIELQADAAVVMSVIQRIHCDEGVGLDKDVEELLRSAIKTARGMMNYAISTTENVRIAYYDIVRNIAWQEIQLGNEQDNEEAGTE